MKPRHFLLTFLFITMLAGGFSLDRINPEFASLGLWGEIRYWLMGMLILLMLANLPRAPQRSYSFKSAWRWVIMVVILHTYLLLTAFWSPYMSDAWQRVPQVASLAIIILMAFFIFRQAPEASFEFFLKLFFWTSTVFMLAALFGPADWREGDRLAAFWGGPNVFVRIIGTGIFAALFFWVKTKKTIWLFPLPALILTAVLSGSRGGLLSLTIGYLFFLFFIFRRTSKSFARLLTISVLTLALFYIPYTKDIIHHFWEERFIQQIVEAQSFVDRDIFFEAGWNTFLQHPVAGIGLNGLASDPIILGHPHNLILNIAAEGGVIGILFFVWALGLLIPRWFRSKNLEQVTALGLGIFYFMAGMFSGTYYDARFMWLFFLLYMLPATIDQTQEENLQTEINLEEKYA